MAIKGYKVFNSDWTCRNYQYKVGETFTHEGEIELCGSGFHFCQKAAQCFNYYRFDSNNKVAEVEAIGDVITSKDKIVTNKIHIVREISWEELLQIVNIGEKNEGLNNTGNYNKGNKNTGGCNKGNKNTGYWNVGNHNTGDKNLGNWNVGDFNYGTANVGRFNDGDRNIGGLNYGDKNIGDWNIGNYNIGDHNFEDYNVGDFNIGNWNIGDCNIGDFNTGVFCTGNKKIEFFDKESDITLKQWHRSDARQILVDNFERTKWIDESIMTEEEKNEHKSYKNLGGYLKNFSNEEAWKNFWNTISDYEKDVIKKIPNFDKEKFKKITGIDIDK